MKKQKIAFHQEIALDEFILALKYVMPMQGIEHVSGMCDARILKEEQTEESLSELFHRAVKHGVFVREGDDVSINPRLFRYLSAWASADKVLTFHKPSFGGNRIITVSGISGAYLATLQDDEKNKVELWMDDDPVFLYAQIAPYVNEKDINKGFKAKKVKKELQSNGITSSFTINHVFQLVALPLDNHTGQNCGEPQTFHVGKEEFEYISGEFRQGCEVTRKSISAFDGMVVALIQKYCSSERELPPDEPDEPEDREPYTRYSFSKITAQKNFPQSFFLLLKSTLRSAGKGILNWKRLLLSIVQKVIFAALVTLWNLYGLCYLNDTFRLSTNSFLGDATAYLFGGTVGNQSGIKGLDIFSNMQNTVLLAASFYFVVGLALQILLRDLLQKKYGSFFKNMLAFPKNLKAYSKNTGHPISYYFWTMLLLAAPLGLFLFNPFTVALIAIMLVCSCIKQDDGMISGPSMVVKSSCEYQKIINGKKKEPLFANLQLRLYGLGMGLLAYTLVNIIVWCVFDYNIWARVIFTIAMIVFALFRLGIIKVNRPNQVAVGAILLLLCGVALAIAHPGMIVLADDGGWTESGRTIGGLLNNTGFGTILGFSGVLGAAAFVGACALGLALGPAGWIAAGVGASALAWSTFSETGRATASDFILGARSPYAGKNSKAEKIATGLNFAVGLVPGVGELWGITSGVRDATYDFSHGNFVSGAFDVFCAGLSVKGLGDGMKLAGEAVINAEIKNWVGKNVSRAVTDSLDDAARAVLSGTENVADDAARAAQSGHSAVYQATREAAEQSGITAMSVEDAQLWNNWAFNKLAKFQIKRNITGQITKPTTTAVKNAMKQYAKDSAISATKQNIGAAVTSKVDEGIQSVVSSATSTAPSLQEGATVSYTGHSAVEYGDAGHSSVGHGMTESTTSQRSIDSVVESTTVEGDIVVEGLQAVDVWEMVQDMSDEEVKAFFTELSKGCYVVEDDLWDDLKEVMLYINSQGGSYDKNVIRELIL